MKPHISRVTALFLLCHVFLILTHAPLVRLLAWIIFSGDSEIFTERGAAKLSLYTSSKLVSKVLSFPRPALRASSLARSGMSPQAHTSLNTQRWYYHTFDPSHTLGNSRKSNPESLYVDKLKASGDKWLLLGESLDHYKNQVTTRQLWLDIAGRFHIPILRVVIFLRCISNLRQWCSLFWSCLRILKTVERLSFDAFELVINDQGPERS